VGEVRYVHERRRCDNADPPERSRANPQIVPHVCLHRCSITPGSARIWTLRSLSRRPDRAGSLECGLRGDNPSVSYEQRRRLAQDFLGEALAKHLMPVEWITACRTSELPVRRDRQRPGRRCLSTVTVSFGLMTPAHMDVFDTYGWSL
jgi:hypothetical protein